MKTLLRTNKIIVPVLLFALLISCDNETSTTFYFVRHAEKETSKDSQQQNDDPKLTKVGEQRAQKLVKVLKQENIAVIYSTDYQRNMKTVEPLATSKNLPIGNYEKYNWEPMLKSIKKQNTEGDVVICGHGDNLLPMIDYLNGERPQKNLGKREYDKIFKVEYNKDTTVVNTITY